jgi:glycosyltransferase 2 family protein
MDWKKLLPIIGIILFVYILWRFNIEKILSVFSAINLLYAALCLLGIPIIFFLFNIQWQMILKRQCIYVSFIYSLKNLFIGYFYGFITPGGFGAYFSAVYLKNESKASLPKCISNIITFNTIDYITIFILGSIGGLFLLGQYPYLFILILILLFTVAFLFIFFLRQKTSKHLFKKLLKTQIFQFIQHYLKDPIESFYEDLPSFKSLLLPVLVSFFSWVVFYTELYLIAQLFNIHIPYITFIFMLAIVSSIAIIPVSIYGLGTRDATLVMMFSLYNIPPENSISFSLFWFTVFLITPSIIGAFITIFENKKFTSRKQR